MRRVTASDLSDVPPSPPRTPDEQPVDRRYRSLRPPAYAAMALLTLGLLAGATSFAIEMNHYGVLADLDRGAIRDGSDLSRAEELVRVADLVRFGVFVAAAIVFLAWFSRAYRNLERLGVPGLRYTPGWAVGAWFVPILNVFRPKQVANDIWRASDPQLARRSEGWHGREVSPWLHWWWAFWVAGGVFGNQAALAQVQAKTVSDQFTASTFAIVADALFALSAALAIAVVNVLTIRQEAQAQAVSEAQALAPV
jgi:hypothetical protein